MFDVTHFLGLLLTTSRRTPADISFVRSRMFYGRPSRDPDTYRIVVGLPYNRTSPLVWPEQFDLTHNTDALNCLNPAYFKKPRLDPATYKDPDPAEQARKARHLSKYIFPLQHGLSNVFSYATSRNETYRQPNFTDREHAIKVCKEILELHSS